MEITLKDAIELLMKRFAFITISTAVGLCSLFIISCFIIHPSYTASVQLYVSTQDTSSSANLNDLNYAQKVVSTYINILQTKVFYQQVLEESGMDYTKEQLKDMTKIRVVNNTEIFEIAVTTHDPEHSYRLAMAMQQEAPELIRNIKSTTQISVVDPVAFPTKPSGPNILVNTLIGGAFGLFLSVILSFFWEMIDVKVKDQEELAKRYDIPILGAIPDFKMGRKITFPLGRFLPKKLRNRRNRSLNNRLSEDIRFGVMEAYKALRTNLLYTIRKDGCRKILVNSPVPEDGKTTTCNFIGIAIAQTGSRVLLMDCDLRKGRQHKFFNLNAAPGISDVLSGMAEENEVIQDTDYKNLQVITMGSIPPNPTELLASVQMEDLIKKLEKDYDYIIIDTAPVNAVSDALSLMKHMDGVLVVVREKNTTYPNISSALTKYQFVDAKILGFVLNGVNLHNGKLKSRYRYYYGKNS